jgi:hypothetical protein
LKILASKRWNLPSASRADSFFLSAFFAAKESRRLEKLPFF